MFINFIGDSMDTMTILLKVMIFSVLGFYILSLFGYKNSPFFGTISPSYGLFSILSMYTSFDNILILFISGVLWGSIIMIFMSVIHKSLKLNMSSIWFGLLNILNYYVLNSAIDKFLMTSSTNSIILLFVMGVLLVLIDISFTFRKLI